MMDVYEFSERDDQTYSQSKSSKQKKRKSKDISKLKANTTLKKSRKKRNKLNDNNIINNSNSLNPPIKLKLVRDQTDPQSFKSIQIINDSSQPSDFTFDFNQQSLMGCKLSDGKEFSLNDIVWAKISGYPFWPSKILSINLSTANQKSAKLSSSQNSVTRLDIIDEYIACVEWLAYDQISYVNCTNLSHFHSDFSNKYSGKIKNKKYFEAVNEAKQLCEENARRSYEFVINHPTVDSVHSCETTEADTSSTLPSHNFTSPESNQSAQSYCHRPQGGARSNPLSNQSDPSSHSNIDYQATLHSDSQIVDHKSLTKIGFCNTATNNNNNTAFSSSNCWELPDLGSNLDFENNNYIPEFSDYEDDCEDIDIAKIEFMIDETHKVTNM